MTQTLTSRTAQRRRWLQSCCAGCHARLLLNTGCMGRSASHLVLLPLGRPLGIPPMPPMPGMSPGKPPNGNPGAGAWHMCNSSACQRHTRSSTGAKSLPRMETAPHLRTWCLAARFTLPAALLLQLRCSGMSGVARVEAARGSGRPATPTQTPERIPASNRGLCKQICPNGVGLDRFQEGSGAGQFGGPGPLC